MFEETSKDDVWWGSVNIKMESVPLPSVSLCLVWSGGRGLPLETGPKRGPGRVREQLSQDLSLTSLSFSLGYSEHTFEINRERAIDYLNTRENVCE